MIENGVGEGRAGGDSLRNAVQRDTVTGVVLAGGQSTRFGSDDKALARFDGSTVLERVVDAVEDVSESAPIVAVRTDGQREAFADELGDRSVHFVRDPPAFEGPLAGLAAAVDHCETSWLFVCGCDMPLLSSRALAWMAQRRDPAIDAVAPTESGQYHPLHTLYRRDAVAEVVATLNDSAGPRLVLERLAEVQTIPVESTPAPVDLEQSLYSVDTKRELEAVAPTQ